MIGIACVFCLFAFRSVSETVQLRLAGRAQVLPGELGSGLALWRHGARSIFDPKTSALPVLYAMPTAHADGACRRPTCSCSVGYCSTR